MIFLFMVVIIYKRTAINLLSDYIGLKKEYLIRSATEKMAG